MIQDQPHAVDILSAKGCFIDNKRVPAAAGHSLPAAALCESSALKTGVIQLD